MTAGRFSQLLSGLYKSGHGQEGHGPDPDAGFRSADLLLDFGPFQLYSAQVSAYLW